jgi:predicted AlkP superfamily phosphohydrolase/phosphomutase
MEDAAPKKVLMIGLDAAEFSLIESWMDEGVLPNLAILRERGACGRLKSTAEWLVGSPWPSFYTGTDPAEHGMYHYLVWRPEKMKVTRPTPDWMPLKPFWRDVAQAGRRVIALDVPLTYAPEPFPGIEISGWATYEILEGPASYPKEVLGQIERQYGKPLIDHESGQLLSENQIEELRDQCLKASAHVSEVGEALMGRGPWDLFLLCFLSTHRAGHQLWDQTNIAGESGPALVAALRDALRAIYIATDVAIGRLLKAAGPEATVIVFSLHGMGPNVSRSDLLREMLTRVLEQQAANDDPAVRPRLVDRVRALIPIEWRAKVKQRLPFPLQDWLTQFWRGRGIDWNRTRAFAPLSDLDGYVRVNLRGREADGIVEPGEEFDALLSRIEDGLMSFRDADTDERVVGSMIRATKLFGQAKTIHRAIPDLMIRWAPSSAAQHRRVVSPRFGAINWPTPGHHPQGRSGNHRPTGFLIAAGENIAAGTTIQGAHILDLAPTVYSLMALPIPTQMQGKPITSLTESHVVVH